MKGTRMKITIPKKGLFFLISALTAATLLFVTPPVVRGAEVLSGSCGASATFSLDSNGTLAISGSGSIQDYTPGTAPWKDHIGSIRRVVLSDSLVGLGVNSLLDLKISSAEIPSSVISIGRYAVGYTYDSASGSYSKVSGFTVIGKPGSEAERYAKSNGFSFTAADVSEPSGSCGEGLTWKLSSSGVLTISGNGRMTDFRDASSAPWAKYAAGSGNYLITSVTVSRGVTSIGSYAFSDCRSLTAVTLPAGLSEIGTSAFENCSALRSVSIPDSTTKIGDKAFTACTALAEITMPGGVTSIGEKAFMLTGLTKLRLPSSVTETGDQAFYGCDRLTTAELPGVTVLAERVFSECTTLRSVTVGAALAEIAPSAFEGCEALSSFTFPSALSSIGDRAFYGCTSLAEAVLPDSLRFLGEYSFYGCTALTSLTTGNGISEIGEGAFEDCRVLRDVNIGEHINYIGERAFTGCPSLRSIEIPVSVKFIAQYSLGYFYAEDPESDNDGVYTKYTDFTLEIISGYPSCAEQYAKDNGFIFTSLGMILSDGGDLTETAKWTINTVTGVLMINGSGRVPGYLYFEETPWALYRDYIKTVIYGTGILNVGDSSFEDCASLTGLTLSNTVTEIGDWAFTGTGLTSLSLPSGIQIINDGAFDSCTQLSNAALPDSLQYIGQFVFRGPNALRSLYIPETVGFIGSFSVGYNQDNTPVSGFVIRGLKDSVAHNYASINSIEFREDGYVEISDPESGCSVSILGSGDDYILSFENLKNTLEPDVFLAPNEYALLYRILLRQDGGIVPVEGTALISFPIPENVNPLAVRIYYMSESGSFSEIDFEVENRRFVFSYGALGSFVITGADLGNLYTITVTHRYEDGTEASPSRVFRATEGAEFTVGAANIEGFSPDREFHSGKMEGADLTLTFTYKPVGIVTRPPETTSSAGTEPEEPGGGSIKTVLIVVEVILIVGIIAAATALILITRKKKTDNRKKASPIPTAGKGGADKFADTIVVPDAPTREIDIQSLFADEPEEDTEASAPQPQDKRNGKT